MGFRDYDPGLNRFVSRDMYNGALADLNLGLSPWTMNRYGFAGGNPVSFVELDGHRLPDEDLRELRKAGYTYIMGKGVVPLPEDQMACGLGVCLPSPRGGGGGSTVDSSFLHQLTHAPCGARDWAEGFQNNTVPIDAGSTCLVNLSVSLGPGMPTFNLPGAINLASGGPGTGGSPGRSRANLAEDLEAVRAKAGLYHRLLDRIGQEMRSTVVVRFLVGDRTVDLVTNEEGLSGLQKWLADQMGDSVGEPFSMAGRTAHSEEIGMLNLPLELADAKPLALAVAGGGALQQPRTICREICQPMLGDRFRAQISPDQRAAWWPQNYLP